MSDPRGGAVSKSMKRTLPWIALAFTLLPACGGSEPSPTPPAGPDSPAAPAAPAAPPAPAASPGPAAPDGGTGTASCSVSQRTVNGRSEFDETCGSRKRECTLEAGGSAWSCMCTAASGTKSACQAEQADSSVITPPPDCCPAG